MSKEIAEVIIPKEIYDEFNSYEDGDFWADWIYQKELSVVVRNLVKSGAVKEGDYLGVRFAPDASLLKLPDRRVVELYTVFENEGELPGVFPRGNCVFEIKFKNNN